MRIGDIRKILQDIDSSTMDTDTLSKQTLQEVFYPHIANGYLWHSNAKKKEKGMSDEECVASLSTPVWSYVSGGTTVDTGISGLQSQVQS